MEENQKANSNKKAIIITIVSIIAVLALGLAVGIGTRYVMENINNNKQVTAEAEKQEEINNKNQTEQKEKNEQEEETKKLEEEARQKEEEEAAKLEEEAKKQEEEAKKREEENKQNQAKKEETKKAVVNNIVNNGKPYYIKVNYTANTVTVYGKDGNGNYTVPVRAMVCSTGAATPRSGVYKTPAKSRWGLLIGPVWGQYCTRITGQILFHSVPYLKQNDPSTLEYWEYDRLGTTRSMGCIRLTVADAKWLYDNCPIGTSVEFYSSSNPGPLGKPGITYVSNAGEPYRGWDPTDPNPNNPWHTKAAKEAEAAAKAAAEKKAAEEAAAKKKAEEESKKKAEEEAAAKKKAEEEAAAKKKAEEEEAKKKAEEANKIIVPNVVGKTEAEAKNLLKDLKVTVQYDEKATKNNGLVSYQSITSSSKVVKGTAITITVNKVKTNTNTTQTNTTQTNTTQTNTTNTTNTTSGNNVGNTANP